MSKWRRNVTKHLSEEDAIGLFREQYKPLASRVYKFLDRFGHVNFGILSDRSGMTRRGRSTGKTVIVIGKLNIDGSIHEPAILNPHILPQAAGSLDSVRPTSCRNSATRSRFSRHATESAGASSPPRYSPQSIWVPASRR